MLLIGVWLLGLTTHVTALEMGGEEYVVISEGSCLDGRAIAREDGLARTGDLLAIRSLSMHYRECTHDEKKATEKLKQAAAIGTAADKLEYYYTLVDGGARSKDIEKYLVQAALLGDSDAQYEIAVSYSSLSTVLAKSISQLEWLNLSARAGNFDAQTMLAQHYLVSGEPVRGAAWLIVAEKSAPKGLKGKARAAVASSMDKLSARDKLLLDILVLEFSR